jgi:hypothetical protein
VKLYLDHVRVYRHAVADKNLMPLFRSEWKSGKDKGIIPDSQFETIWRQELQLEKSCETEWFAIGEDMPYVKDLIQKIIAAVVK